MSIIKAPTATRIFTCAGRAEAIIGQPCRPRYGPAHDLSAILWTCCPGDQRLAYPTRNGRYAVQRIGAKGNKRATLARRDINEMGCAYLQITTVIGLGIGQLQAQRNLARLLPRI